VQSIQPKSQRTSANGTSDVTIFTAPAVGKTGMLVRITFTNLDSAAATPILKKTIGGVTKEVMRATAVPAGASDAEWCSAQRPFLAAAGESYVGALAGGISTTQPEWVVESFEGTD
jgi:hypothetical protein